MVVVAVRMVSGVAFCIIVIYAKVLNFAFLVTVLILL